MSPTGRRRFRKMNRRFRQRGPAVVRKRARKTNGGKARKMILVQWWGRDPLPLPPKPFTTRSIVGMTQGARKRAARQDAMGVRTAVHDFRTSIRIGETLRPCPGCCACWGCSAVTILGEITECCGPKTRGKSRRQIRAMRKWEARMWDDCDGSGVLPARRA